MPKKREKYTVDLQDEYIKDAKAATQRALEQNYRFAHMALTTLYIILTFLIIITANKIVTSALGKFALLFGFLVLATVTITRIFQKW